ncbi:hypothetical protein BZA77DRAFT_178281 [Pyronema omphalodes]|nr:hypothetical protein BZA77DRAFT_178281 [Pyronema omphalodes]
MPTTITTVTNPPKCISLTGVEELGSANLITAPCTRCGHHEEIKSILRVVAKPTTVDDNDAVETPVENHNLDSTLSALNAILRRHGEDLNAITLIKQSVPQDVAPGNHLVYDPEDLKHLTSGVTRLMCTLHDQVTRLDIAEREMKQKAEKLEEEKRKFEEETREFRRLTMLSQRERKSGQSFDSDDEKRPHLTSRLSFYEAVVWDDEKEAQLQAAEKKLSWANRNWSPEQEDVLPMVEALREEKRRAKKYSALLLSTSPSAPKTRRSFSMSKASKKDLKLRKSTSAVVEVGDKDRKRRGSEGDEEKKGNSFLRFFGRKSTA